MTDAPTHDDAGEEVTTTDSNEPEATVTYYALRHVDLGFGSAEVGDVIPQTMDWPHTGPAVRNGDIAPVLVRLLNDEDRAKVKEYEDFRLEVIAWVIAVEEQAALIRQGIRPSNTLPEQPDDPFADVEPETRPEAPDPTRPMATPTDTAVTPIPRDVLDDAANPHTPPGGLPDEQPAPTIPEDREDVTYDPDKDDPFVDPFALPTPTVEETTTPDVTPEGEPQQGGAESARPDESDVSHDGDVEAEGAAEDSSSDGAADPGSSSESAAGGESTSSDQDDSGSSPSTPPSSEPEPVSSTELTEAEVPADAPTEGPGVEPDAVESAVSEAAPGETPVVEVQEAPTEVVDTASTTDTPEPTPAPETSTEAPTGGVESYENPFG